MSDPKPYTPEEVARLFHEKGRPDWGPPGTNVEVDPQRLEATVQALAEAARHVRALLENADPWPIQQSIQEQAAMAWLAAREDL